MSRPVAAAKTAGAMAWLGWASLVLAALLAAAPVPVLFLWLVPAAITLAIAVVLLARDAPIHAALLLTGSLVALPLAWGLGMIWLVRAADWLVGGAM